MRYPLKYKHLLEIDDGDVPKPSHVWVTYCVCAVKKKSCAWAGWMIEAAYEKPDAEPGHDLLPSPDEFICPRCGRQVYRTGASYRFDFSTNQTPLHGIPGIDYGEIPIKYTKK